MKSATALVSLLATLVTALACGDGAAPQVDIQATVTAAVVATAETVRPEPTDTPTVEPPPSVLATSSVVHSANSLIVGVTVELDRDGRVYVEYGNDLAGSYRTPATESIATDHEIPIVRLKPEATYNYRVFVLDEDDSASPGLTGSFTTGPLPEPLATIQVSSTGRPTSELVMMDHRDNQQSYILIMDQDSEIVWYYANPNPFPPDRAGIQAIRQGPNHNLVFYVGSPRTPCCIREITPVGDIVDQLVANHLDQIPHHDFLILEDGRVMYLADVERVIDDAANGGEAETRVTGDAIRVWDPSTGTTEELWNAFDFLSTDDRVVWDADNVRWTHFNSIQIGPRENIVVSSRNLNQVISISPDFDEIEWRLNGPNSSFEFEAPEDRFYRQHTATELPNGNILVFDNGGDRPVGQGGEYSRALELALRDYDSAAVKVWEYRSTPDIYASFISSAHRLANGNTLINFGTTPDVEATPITVVEVDRQGNEIWRMEMLGPSLRNRFRAYPIESINGEKRIK